MRGLARQRWTRALGSCFAKSPAAHRYLANFAPIGESYKSVPTNVHHELCSWVFPSEVAYFLDTVVADSSEIGADLAYFVFVQMPVEKKKSTKIGLSADTEWPSNPGSFGFEPLFLDLILFCRFLW